MRVPLRVRASDLHQCAPHQCALREGLHQIRTVGSGSRSRSSALRGAAAAGRCSPPAGNQRSPPASSGRDTAPWSRGCSPPLPAELGPSAGIKHIGVAPRRFGSFRNCPTFSQRRLAASVFPWITLHPAGILPPSCGSCRSCSLSSSCALLEMM